MGGSKALRRTIAASATGPFLVHAFYLQLFFRPEQIGLFVGILRAAAVASLVGLSSAQCNYLVSGSLSGYSGSVRRSDDAAARHLSEPTSIDGPRHDTSTFVVTVQISNI